MNETTEVTIGRLRPHPTQRFAGAQHLLNLPDLLATLESEPHHATQGHHQMTLLHHGPVAMVLFSFEAGGVMPDHAANGMVTIHVLNGELSITVDGATHNLATNQILALQPGVRHSLAATSAAQMLLTVHLQQEHNNNGQTEKDK